MHIKIHMLHTKEQQVAWFKKFCIVRTHSLVHFKQNHAIKLHKYIFFNLPLITFHKHSILWIGYQCVG